MAKKKHSTDAYYFLVTSIGIAVSFLQISVSLNIFFLLLLSVIVHLFVFLKHPFSKSFYFFVVVLFCLLVLSFACLFHIPSESVPTRARSALKPLLLPLPSCREFPPSGLSSGGAGLCLSRGFSMVARDVPPAGSVGIEGRALEGLAKLEVTVEGEEGVWLQKEARVRVVSGDPDKAVERLGGEHSPSMVEG